MTIQIAYVLYNDGRRSFLGILYQNDQDAFNSLLDEMMNISQKDESVNSFGFEEVSALGALADDISYCYPE